MKNALNSLAFSIVSCTLAVASLQAHAGVAVVVGSKSPATALTQDQAAQLFLGKTRSIPGAGDATLIDQADGSPVRDEFYTKATGKNAAQVKAIWSRLVFSGAAQMPTAAGNAAEVKKLLGSNPSAISYIDAADIDATVKVLLKLD